MYTVNEIFNSISNKCNDYKALSNTLLGFLDGKTNKKNDLMEDYLYKVLFKNNNPDLIKLLQLVGVLHQKRREQQIISNTNHRKHYGIYYTDYNIAKLITEETLSPVKDPSKLLNLTFLEPCVGNGIFIFSLIDYIFKNNPTISSDSLAQQALNNIYCADIDGEAIDLLKQSLPSYVMRKYRRKVKLQDNNCFVGDLLFNVQNKNILKNDPKHIFNIPQGFDIVMTNPPYRLLKINSNKYNKSDSRNYAKEMVELIGFIRENAFYKYNEGTLNYYKLFVEEIVENYTHANSNVGLLIPVTILNDKQSEQLRKRIFSNYKLSTIYIIPEKNSFFEDVSQSFCFFGIDKGKRSKTVYVNPCVASSQDFNKRAIKVEFESIKKISNTWPIIIEKQTGWDILNKIHCNPKLGALTFIRNLRGELDLTLDKDFITDKKTPFNLLRGINIGEFTYEQGDAFVDKSFLKKIASKRRFVEVSRIVCQQIVNIHTEKRLKFVIIPSGMILGNSCNFIARENSLFDNNNVTLQYLVGVLNSLLLDWRFRITSTNNHVNNYELDELPIMIPSKIQKESIEQWVKNITTDYSDTVVTQLNIEIFKMYGLNTNETNYILSKYPKSTLIENIKNAI